MHITRCLRTNPGYIYGTFKSSKGGRLQNNSIPQGLTVKTLKRHYELQPLFGILAGAMVLVASYAIRAAVYATDVNWRKSKTPWDTYGYYDGKQYKFLNPSGIDYKEYGKERPRF
ncbi:cytochrome c oxidase subunit NDUFA4 [Eurytemora carolleeae]|uniref:cytochrome c oxidase subunit NDUFA4 n=1 Tax=Eurytemora carolleeae TaxID=1294199 RepID=UPI000C76EB54|nr:cytochrome c oxidase subunit NDUFA4 [Eurytemora carolleeae]|eukprot:XP_023343897.1 cytochrome c oxidase subunit NDUFA4-like [Eurytemora affinis]